LSKYDSASRPSLYRNSSHVPIHHNQVAGAIHRVGDPTLPHKLGLADKSVVSRNTRSAVSWPTRRAMRCNPF
jgi:hypothetical protein